MEEASAQKQDTAKMKRNLLMCVDAFGTLFRPRSPIAEQYGTVARGMGVKISDEEVAQSFKSGEFPLRRCHGFRKQQGRDEVETNGILNSEADCSQTAFKETSKAYPNYGKKTDMGARQWWTEVCDLQIFLFDFLSSFT